MTGLIVAATSDGRSGWVRDTRGVRHFPFVAPSGPPVMAGQIVQFSFLPAPTEGGLPVAVLRVAGSSADGLG